ncbi:MAG: hypothetical protein ACRYFW_12160 [Janthinobacterium lividum]
MDGRKTDEAERDIQRTGRAKRRPARATDFSETKRQLFLNTLAATANVALAARTAGVNVTTAYRLRHLAPEFAAVWDQALDIGYLRLEEQLLARALEAVDALAIDPTAVATTPLPPLAAASTGAGAGGGQAGVGNEETGPDAGKDDASVSGQGMPDHGLTGQNVPGQNVPGQGPASRDAVGGGTTGWTGRGLPPAYQLALALLNRRNGVLRGNPRRPGGVRKAMSGDEITALLLKRLDMAAVVAGGRAAAPAMLPAPPDPTPPDLPLSGPTRDAER